MREVLGYCGSCGCGSVVCGVMSTRSVCGHVHVCRLETSYQASAGSYVPLEDMFYGYLSSCSSKVTLSLTEFSSLVR